MSRPTLLVWQPEARARLRSVAALREVAEVVVPDDPEAPLVRLVRSRRPDAVLLALGRGRLAPGLQLCRRLKTDSGRVPTVGLTDPWSRLRQPDQALTACEGDGYLGGIASPDALRDFARELLAGRRPVHLHPPAGGLLGRLLGRGR